MTPPTVKLKIPQNILRFVALVFDEIQSQQSVTTIFTMKIFCQTPEPTGQVFDLFLAYECM